MRYHEILLLGALVWLPAKGAAQSVKLYEPVEWTFSNPSFTGNPYELVANARFEHSTADDIVTELYFDGDDRWKLRFTGTAVGEWRFRTSSTDPELDGKTGSLIVAENPGAPGFLTKVSDGSKWGRSGTSQAFVPQLAMFHLPNEFYQNPGLIDEKIRIFFGDHGFNGFHTAVFGRWFDLATPRYENLPADPNPDPRTFEALESLISKVYGAGGMVHLWAWGDEQQHLTPIRWGINGRVDRRLQRYIAARLGPLPGWSMGYGFDLDEWVSASEIESWRNYMQDHLGWFHFLGGRPEGPNSGTDHSHLIDWNEPLDYSSYEHHRPSYQVYVAALRNVPGQPVLSEDRFRVRPSQRAKDYTPEDSRRGLWHSTMAGGVGNIWGYQIPIVSEAISNPYPNASELLTNARFWKKRFRPPLTRANRLTNGWALQDSNRFFVFYRESTAAIDMDLSEMDSALPAVAVDTKKRYEEIPLGELTPGFLRFEAPYPSDWAVAVGGPTPGSFIENDLGSIDSDAGLFRVAVSDGDTEVATVGGRESRRNLDPSSDLYVYFNVVGSWAYQGNRPEVEITLDYLDRGNAILRLQYDSLSAAYATHPDVIFLTDSDVWKQKTWLVTDAHFGNRQNGGADFRVHRSGDGFFYLDRLRVSSPATLLPEAASAPAPFRGATDVGVTTDLTWSAGARATSYDLFFGTQNPPMFLTRESATQYQPGALAVNTTYFWRVDAVNAAGRATGDLWSFTTGDVLLTPRLLLQGASALTIDGQPGDWNLSEFTRPVRGGELESGDVALVGFDGGVLYFGGRATPLSLPIDGFDHSAKIYGRHDATHLYFLARVLDEDIRAPHGLEMNWANDCVEIYLDPGGQGGAAPIANSSSHLQLVIDAANRRNVYMTSVGYRTQILGGVVSAVTMDGTGWWLEVAIEKSVLAPNLPAEGRFGLDFNFRDNDRDNDPTASTVYTWADIEQSASFPSKIPDRWGDARLPGLGPLPLPGPAIEPSPANGAIDVALGAQLDWHAGSHATAHDLYFGTSNPPPFIRSQASTGFDPTPLVPDTRYFFRVDEVNPRGTTPGPLWSFTTGSEPMAAALNVKPIGTLTIEIDGSPDDWNLSEFVTLSRGGDVIAGDIALVGFDSGTLYWAGRFTGASLPANAADHTARVYSRHSPEYLYFLMRIEDEDLELSFGPEMNWANDCAEIYFDPGLDGGATAIQSSDSDFQLVIDGSNQVNVYMTTSSYRNQLLSSIDSAVQRDATGWWLELRIDKAAIRPALPSGGSFGLDFNFRDNDRNNAPDATTIYSWSDFEQSGSFPSKIPDRWGLGRLESPPAAPPAPEVAHPADYVSLDRVEDIIQGTSTQNLGLLHGMTYGGWRDPLTVVAACPWACDGSDGPPFFEMGCEELTAYGNLGGELIREGEELVIPRLRKVNRRCAQTHPQHDPRFCGRSEMKKSRLREYRSRLDPHKETMNWTRQKAGTCQSALIAAGGFAFDSIAGWCGSMRQAGFRLSDCPQ